MNKHHKEIQRIANSILEQYDLMEHDVRQYKPVQKTYQLAFELDTAIRTETRFNLKNLYLNFLVIVCKAIPDNDGGVYYKGKYKGELTYSFFEM
jgi:hypothetical protein